MNKKIGLFAGSFDPFTIGHANIVERSLSLFDEVIILCQNNSNKQRVFDVDKMVNNLRNYYNTDPNFYYVSVYNTSENILTVDYAKQFGATHLIRGIRSTIDFEYEKNIATINKEIGNIETVFILTDPNLAHISSSMVRELIKYDKDVSKYLPFKLN